MIMEKEIIISTILDVCKDMGLNYITKVKSAAWNADVVVEHDTYKVAFNVCKCPRNVEATYKAMRKERVCGCWLLLPAVNSSYQEQSLPCFNLIPQTDKKLVCLNSVMNDNSNNKIELSTFLHSLIDGKIRFAKQTEINKVELCFYKNGCWKCHRENDVYFVNRLFSQEGVMIDGQHLMMDEDITFNPSIIKGLKKYIHEHPSETFIMGEIKPRYSKTIGEAYPSFGCAQCDSIFGNFYLQENMMELMYCTDSLRKAIITLDEPIKVLAHCWYKVNN